MDSPCIKQTVCKVLKIFQYGKYLVAYVLKVSYLVYIWETGSITTLFLMCKLDFKWLTSLWLVTDNNSRFLNQWKENDSRNHFMIDLHQSTGHGQDLTTDRWIYSQTCDRPITPSGNIIIKTPNLCKLFLKINLWYTKLKIII